MTISATIPRYSVDEYLALERRAEHRSEYIDGQIVAMSGGSFAHSLVGTNLSGTLGNLLADSPCIVVNSDMRVRVDGSLYTYPDATVVCSEPEIEDVEGDTLLNPTLIVEVLSPSTEAYDRGEKWRRYRRIPSLRQYVLVAQTTPLVEVFTRSGDTWVYSDASGLDASIRLESIGCTLALRDVYVKVRLRPEDLPVGGEDGR